MTDLHIHTKFSYDADSKPTFEQYILKAINSGATRIGFSDHYDLDWIKFNLSPPRTMFDLNEFMEELNSVRAKYKGKIEVLCGVEFGYLDSVVEDYRKIIKEYNFDYVINSVHIPDKDGDCWFTEYFNGKEQKATYEHYLKVVLESVKAELDYQIVGHIGYISRNAPYTNPKINYSDYPDLYDAILKEIVLRDASLELNTSVRSAGSVILPDIDVLKRYKDLGGKKITIGSDAHRVEDYCRNFDEAVRAIRSVGFDKICYYKDKKAYLEDL